MISFEKALETILDFSEFPVEEVISIEKCLNRVLFRTVVSDIDIPHSDLAAMDGFACRAENIDTKLRILETIAAGHAPTMSIGIGECSRIMTGAVVPAGANHVVMVEHTHEENRSILVTKKSGGSNIRYRAEDIAIGDTVVKKGARITPAIVAVLASAGCSTVHVCKKIAVGVIASGDELIEPGQIPGPAQIRNSNSYQLFAQTESCGCVPKYYGIVPDALDATQALIRKALSESDVVLLSGGISAGNFDFVPGALKDLGIDLKFAGVSMKPGKPALFGVVDNKAIFGMPGNPVSTFVVFELFVRPYLMKRMGHVDAPLIVKAVCGEPFNRKKADRLEVMPVFFDSEGCATFPRYHGSAHIHSYLSAHGMFCIPEGITSVERGSQIQVRML
jgi:molybdopterin molybdotransferase